MHLLGISGMPRRVFDYPSCFLYWNYFSTLGIFLVMLSLIWFFLSLSPIFDNLLFKLFKKKSNV
jgi:heme/copper-type cytochrome/quinol oxidase subunit 1